MHLVFKVYALNIDDAAGGVQTDRCNLLHRHLLVERGVVLNASAGSDTSRAHSRLGFLLVDGGRHGGAPHDQWSIEDHGGPG
jgi:hypothetical protein